jgi:hypothetical protein
LLRPDVSEKKASLNRSERTDALLEGEELRVTERCVATPELERFCPSVSRAAAADDHLGAEGRVPLTAAMRGE